MNARTRNRILLLGTVFILLAQAACIRQYTRGGGIEPTYRPMEDKPYEVVGTAECESSSFYFFWLLPFTPEHRLEQAIEQAIDEKGGDNMIDVRWCLEKQHWILGTVNIIRAKGRVIRYRDDR